MELTPIQMSIAALAGLLLGFSKTGATGAGVLTVPLLAMIFQGKIQVGAILPMLIFGDLFATVYHGRRAHLPTLARLLPWVMPGLIAGYFALKALPSEHMVRFLGGLVLLMAGLRVVQARGGQWIEEHAPHTWWFSALMGFLAGFATMVGNLAGTIMSVYLLSRGMDKRRFMGTGTWYYLAVNAIKVPFYARLGLITAETLLFDLKTTPFIAGGALLGIFFFRRIPQQWFDRIILLLAVAAATRMLLQ